MGITYSDPDIDTDADTASWAAVVRAAGFDAFAATPTSANLRTLLTDESGSGAALFAGGALGTPASGVLTNCTGLPAATGLAGLGAVASGLLYGLTLSNNTGDATNDIDITAGTCIDSTNAVLMAPTAQTKRLDAGWAAGTGNGFRNSAIAIANTTYHIYAVCKAAGADPDYYAHTSATVATVITALQAETGGSLYLYARRIGSILRESAAIVAFSQDGDEFLRTTVIPISYNAVPADDTAFDITLHVPLGIKVRAKFSALFSFSTGTANAVCLVSSKDQTDVDPGSGSGVFSLFILGSAGNTDADLTAAIKSGASGEFFIRTNTSAIIRGRLSGRTASTSLFILTQGWIDTRGRLA